MTALRRWREALPAVVLVAAGLLAYWNSLKTPFIYDDELYIVDNMHLRSLWPIWKTVIGTARPLVYFTWALNYAVSRLNPISYHLVNLAIHLIASIALYGVVRRSLLSAPLCRRYGAFANELALASALLWVVHPLTTESVTFAYQRAESMMGLWYLLTLYAVIRGASSRKASRWYTVAIIFCACGMASKAVMVTAPLIILLYDRFFLAGSFQKAWRLRWSLYTGLMLTWLLLAWLLAAASAEYSNTAGIEYKDLTAWGYFLTQPGVLWRYLRLAVWPHSLVFDYCGWPAARTAGQILPPLAIIGSLLVLTVRAIWHKQPIGFLGAWFFGILAPTSSIIPIADIIAEHRMYLPLAGCTVLAVMVGYELLQSIQLSQIRRPVALFLVIVTVSALGVLTFRRNKDYRSPFVMWQDVLAKRPNNARAHFVVGLILGSEGKLDEATRYFARAYELNPHFSISHYNMAVSLSRQGRYTEAFICFEELIRLYPKHGLVRYSYGLSLANANRLDEAINQFNQALVNDRGLLKVHYDLAVAYFMKGDRAKAAENFAQAILLQENNPEERDGIASVVGQVGLTDQVAALIQQANAGKPAGAP